MLAKTELNGDFSILTTNNNDIEVTLMESLN